MMKNIVFVASLFSLISCGNFQEKINPLQLNGYWEIEKVTLRDGTVKEYSISTIVDFIETDSIEGRKTKVSPSLDGTFKNNGVVESFVLQRSNDSLFMNYKTAFDSWREVVIESSDSLLVVKNRDGNVYHYKKFVPFNIE